MNIALWVVQSLLALLLISGGGYKVTSSGALATQFPALPAAAWRLLGIVEVVGGLSLVLPMALQWMPHLTSLAALVLCIEAIGLSIVYARKSLAMTAQNPLVFSIPMALMLALVYFKR